MKRIQVRPPGRGKILKKRKVLIALSGGIDSAVSAYLLQKQGYEVEGAFMKNWSSTQGLLRSECPWLQDRQDALRVAAFLKIPLHTLDFEQQYQDTVMDYFFKEYQAGRTPNPDVMCNKEIKFKLLYNWAMDHGFDTLATGHYAQVKKSENKKIRKSVGIINYNLIPTTYYLVRSKDEFKDQTYFIYNIKTEQLPHILFPIGGMKKIQVRALAKKLNLPNADKKESMGLCFVGKIRLKDFLEQKLIPMPGPIVDLARKKLGNHEGLHNYTIGQRQGIKIGGSGPYYVVRKELASNTLVITKDPNDPALLTREIEIHSVNWIGEEFGGREGQKIKLSGRYRHQGVLVPVVVQQVSGGHWKAVFSTPQNSVASGQSLVLYEGKRCIGGGIIV